MTTLEVRSIRVKQTRNTPVYSFFLRAKDILRVADISRIRRDDVGSLLGYQRSQVQRHVDEIVEYLDSQDVLFPNAIILAMSSAVRFRKSRGPSIGDADCEAGNLTIPLEVSGQRPAWIVDGQQRTLALMKSRRQNLRVPVTAFISDDFETHRNQFLLINKVKPLPSGLINELLPVVNTVLPPSLAKNKIPSALCDIMNKDPESPFHGLIVRQTTDRRETPVAVVADNSLIQAIRTSLNSVHGCLYQYKNVATDEIDVESVRRVLNLYWTQVSEAFPEAWGEDPKRSRLMGGVGIKAMGYLMDRIMGTIAITDKNACERTRDSLAPLKGRCAWTQGSWDILQGMPWNHLQNTPGHVKLLANALIRVCMGLA